MKINFIIILLLITTGCSFFKEVSSPIYNEQLCQKDESYYESLLKKDNLLLLNSKFREEVFCAIWFYKNLSLENHNSEVIQSNLSRLYYIIAYNSNNSKETSIFSKEGQKYAKNCLAINPNNGICHYYLAINIGVYAKEHITLALSLLPQILYETKCALSLNELYDYSGPNRVLGRLYAQAPSYPISFGDLEESIKHLKRAVSLFPDYLPNRLHLAESFILNESYQEAQKELNIIIEKASKNDIIYEGESIKEKSLNLMKSIEEKLSS